MKKRFVAFLLVLIMVLGMLPVSAIAAGDVSPQALNTGHKIDVTFTVLYVSDEFNLGYNYGTSEQTQFVCQYSTNHSDGAYSNHIIAISDIKAAAGRATVNSGYQIVGWSKEANANPKTWDLNMGGTTACNKGTPIYLVAKDPNPQVTYTLNYHANGGDENSVPASQTEKSNTGKATFTVSSAIPTRDGYTFLGWADDADATVVQYHGGDEITLTKDNPTKTIYAVWEAKNPQPPLIPAPSYDDLKSAIGQIQVKDVSTPSCGTENYDLIDNTQSEPFNWTKTARADQPGKYDVTIKTAPYVAKYNSEKTKTHELNNANQTTLKLVISYENNKWVLDDGLRVIEVKHSEQNPPTDIPNPNPGNIAENLKVKVVCTTPNSGHEPAFYSLIDGTFTHTDIEQSGDYPTCSITISPDSYIRQYSTDKDCPHTTSDQPKTVPLFWNKEAQKWAVNERNISLNGVIFNAVCEAVPDTFTVTYTDGVDGEEVFADQVYSGLRKDSETPAFNGTPNREGYTFAGWDPEVAETVTANATYTAKWTPVEPTREDIFKALNGLVTVTCINRFWKDGNKNMDCGQGQYAAKAGIAGQDYTLVKGENAGTWVVTFPVTNFVKSFKQDPAHNLYTKDTLSWYIRWEDNAWTSEPVESGVDDLVKLTHAPTDWREVAKIATGGKSDCIHTSCVNGETGVCDYGITVPFVYFNTDVVSVEPEDGVPGSYIATFKVDRYIDTCAKACNDKNFPDAPRTHKLLTQETVQWRLYATPEADEKIGNNVLNHVWEAEPVEAGKDDVCTIAHNWVVTFNPDNGEPAFTQNVEYEGKATEPAAPEKTGYTFEGWSVKVLPAENDADHLDADGADDAADETLLKAGDTYTITAGGVIFTAQWEARTDTPYTVEHYLENLDGSYALDTTEPLKGTTDTTVTAAAKSYDNFTYDSTVPGTVASGNIAGDGSLVLKLFYTRNTYDYTVRHIKQLPDGSYDEANAEVETLSGKFEALAAVTAKDYGSHYPTNDAGTKQNIKIEKNLTIDVKYDLDNHTLTFETNGGSAIAPVTVRHGNAVARPADPTKDKYTFIGWYADPEFTEEYDFATVLEADKTIYAKFELTSTPIGDIYVRYDVLHIKQLPDGSYDLANAEVEHLSAKKDTTVTAVVKDYRATHHINVNSTLSKLTDTAIQPYPGADGKPVYTILPVYYDLDFHTLTFDTMGGSRIDPVTVRHGNAVAKPKDPVNGGYIFDGWYTDKTYRTPYNFATVLTQDTTIYAKWFLIALPGVTIKKTTPKLNTSDHFAYVQGYPDGTVKPTGNITRAETAAILFRLMDEGSRKTYYSTKSGFRDVATGSWYNTYVATLNNAGVITDSSNGYFRPNEAITRAELAAMLANFTETAGAANYFNDVSASYWAANAIAICAKLGWITGYPDGSFRPDRNVTRAELMAMINRATGRAPKSADAFLPGMKTWSDNTADKWYYLDVQEATNSHSYTVKVILISFQRTSC